MAIQFKVQYLTSFVKLGIFYLKKIPDYIKISALTYENFFRLWACSYFWDL